MPLFNRCRRLDKTVSVMLDGEESLYYITSIILYYLYLILYYLYLILYYLYLILYYLYLIDAEDEDKTVSVMLDGEESLYYITSIILYYYYILYYITSI